MSILTALAGKALEMDGETVRLAVYNYIGPIVSCPFHSIAFESNEL